MKLVKGTTTSSKPISLYKAASVLHKFINEETGASQAVSVYLKRASAAFDELVEFHNELKGRTRHKHKKNRMETVDVGALTDGDASHRENAPPAAERGRFIDSVEEQSFRSSGELEGGGFDDEGIRSQRKREKDFSGPEAKVRDGGAAVRIVEDKRDKTKKRKKEEVEDGRLNDSEERHIRKNKKSKRISEDEK